jgi:FLVCR family feline leukemia virus subgroup C receptor-related protein
MGSIIPAYQVYSGRGLSFMLLWSALAGTAILALNFLASPVLLQPPVHAEFDAYLQTQSRKDLDFSSIPAIFRQMLVDFRTLLSDCSFVLLFLAFTLQTGTSWALLGISGQLIGPCGYDEAIMSGTLAGFNFAGVVGSFVVANVLRVWHRGRDTVQKAWFLVCCGTCLWCLGANRPGNVINVVAAYTMYGILSSPLIPITLEYAAEMTYPVPADNSAALLFTGVNYFSLALTLGVAQLLATDPVSRTCSSIASQAAIMLMVFAIFGAVVLLPMKPTYRRTTMSEKANDQPLKSPRIMPR